MTRVTRFKREEIIATALELVREEGDEALTARILSKKIGCSTSPLFTVFGSFEEMREEVWQAAVNQFSEYVRGAFEYKPAFKEFGIRQVRFARENPNLFKFIFLRPGKNPEIPEGARCLAEIQMLFGLTEEQTKILFNQIRIFGCGLSMLLITGAESYTDDEVSDMLSHQFAGTMMFLRSGMNVNNISPRPRGEGGGGPMPPLPDIYRYQ